MEILIGADPEVFMKRRGMLVSAHGAIPGDKHNPFKVNNGAVQVDGMALEFNIDPANSEDMFAANIESVMAQLRDMVPGCELAPQPVAHFGQAYIDAQPKEARALGCDPDYNAWTGKRNPLPDGDMGFRTGAGHVHIGWTAGANIHDPIHIATCQMVVKQMDYYLGVPSVIFDRDHQRRSMYGQAGAFRPKPYGVEYRTLSNHWLSTPKLIRWVFSQTQKGMSDLMSGSIAEHEYEDRCVSIINYSYLTQAKELLKQLELEVPNVG